MKPWKTSARPKKAGDNLNSTLLPRGKAWIVILVEHNLITWLH